MVIISHTGALALQAYSTAHLTLEMKRTVQQGFYNGTYARFGDPQTPVTIHDRPDFHTRSHYDIPNILDSEGMEDTFVLIDEKTPELDAIWLVNPTWYSRSQEEYEQPGDIIHYPVRRSPSGTATSVQQMFQHWPSSRPKDAAT